MIFCEKHVQEVLDNNKLLNLLNFLDEQTEIKHTLKDFKNAKIEIHKIHLFLVYQFH